MRMKNNERETLGRGGGEAEQLGEPDGEKQDERDWSFILMTLNKAGARW